MNYINLTPHDVVLLVEGRHRSFHASGIVARVSSFEETIKIVDGIPYCRRTFGEVENLPQPSNDTIYVVSSMVLSCCGGRPDVVAPDTGSTAIRDEKGRIIAVTRFVIA